MIANRIILQHKYARIITLFAKTTGITIEKSLGLFYDSKTFELINEGIADLHCRSDEYLVDELLIEYKYKTK